MVGRFLRRGPVLRENLLRSAMVDGEGILTSALDGLGQVEGPMVELLWSINHREVGRSASC